MFKRHYVIIFLLILPHVLFLGCAKPPTEEMIRAEKAIDEARQKKAEVFANDIFIRTEKSFEKAKKAVVERRYEEARLIALDTARFAEQAVTIAQFNKEKIVKETETGIKDVRGTIDKLKNVEQESFRKNALIKYDDLQEILTNHESTLGEIRERLDNDEVMGARDDIKRLYSEIEGLKEKVSLSQKIKKKKKR